VAGKIDIEMVGGRAACFPSRLIALDIDQTLAQTAEQKSYRSRCNVQAAREQVRPFEPSDHQERLHLIGLGDNTVAAILFSCLMPL
jgi:hypothetical protein